MRDGAGDGAATGGGGEKPGGGEKERAPSPKNSSVDQPTITTGAGSVWVTWNNNGLMQAAGAAVTGLDQVGDLRQARGPRGDPTDAASATSRWGRPGR